MPASINMQPLATQNPWALLITSSGGNGHLQVAKVLEKKLSEGPSPITVKVKDLMLDFLGKMGERARNYWNSAQKSGKISRLERMVRVQRFVDWFFYWKIKRAVLRNLVDFENTFGRPPEYIINDQVMGCKAILDALSDYNYKLKKKFKNASPVTCQLHMTDLPEKADHFYGPLSRLSRKNKNLLTIFSPKLQGSAEDASYSFFKRKTGLRREQIIFLENSQLPVDAIYKDPKLKSISELTFNGLSEGGREEYFKKLPNVTSYFNWESQTFKVKPDDKVYSMMLGSQPSEYAVDSSIDKIISLAHQATDPGKQYHFFVFCGKDEGPGSLFRKMCDKLLALEVPGNLRVVPLPFQDPQNIAKVMARSDVRIIRSGGVSCFENKVLMDTLNESNKSKTFIWSENPASALSLRYQQLHNNKDSQKQLMKFIPLWEGGNAENLDVPLISSGTFTSELAEGFVSDSHTDALAIKEKDLPLFGRLNSLLYKKRNILSRMWQCISGSRRQKILSITKQFNKSLEALETSGVVVAGQGAAKQAVDFHYYIEQAEGLQRLITAKRGPRLAHQRSLLDRRIVALKYRISAQNGGLSPAPQADNDMLKKIQSVAQQWKQKSLPLNDQPALNQREQSELSFAARHKEFATLLLRDKKLQDEFNTWVLVHRLSAEIFIQYASADRVLSHSIKGKIGRACPAALQIKTIDGKKHLAMAFVQQKSSGEKFTAFHEILKVQKKIPFTPDWQPTILSLFNQMESKDKLKQKVEVMQEGIVNWSPANFSWYDGIKTHEFDFAAPNWWENLPIFKTLTSEEVEKEYGAITNDSRNWFLSARSNFQREQLEFDKNHSYLDMIIPQADGMYHIYPFGRFAANDPITMKDKFNFALKSTHGRIVYPDKSVYYSDRKNYGCTIGFSESVGKEVMGELAKKIQESLHNELPFQLAGENCAKFVQNMVDFTMDRIGTGKLEIFKADVLKLQPTGVAGLFFRLPRQITAFFIKTVLRLLFRPGRKMEIGNRVYSVLHTDFWQKWLISHPIEMVLKLQRGELKPFYNYAPALSNLGY